MKQTVYFNDFYDVFQSKRPDDFSYEGLKALFDYLEQYEQDCDQELELDVIALCCDFAEYDSIDQFRSDYGDEYQTFDDIEQKTTLIKIDDEKFIVLCF